MTAPASPLAPPAPPIFALRADRVAVPFRRPFATATGMWLKREAWIVTLRATDGRTGVGEAALEPADGEAAAAVLVLLLREAAGNARATGGLPGPTDLEVHGRPGRALRAAIEAAVLDLAGTHHPALGDGGDGVGVNATIPVLGAGASVHAALQYVEAGFRTLKLKAGTERETASLLERVRAVRRAVGPEVRLRLDVNGAWNRQNAEERLTALAGMGLDYVEQPLPAEDVEGLADLRRLGLGPIAVDESVTSVRAAREILEAGAADVLVVKPARVGGPNAVREIAELAAARGVGVVVNTLLETGVGIAAALAAAAALPPVAERSGAVPSRPDHGLATAGLLEHDLLVHSLVIDAGRMRLPAEAGTGGLGIALDERALARFRVETVEAPG